MDERTHARYMADIAYFLSKMEAEPNSGYFIPIALAYNKLEKYDETIAMCKTAVERFPSNCAAKTFLAEAYVYKGLFDQARELLFDVTAEDDNNYKALKLLGIICKEKGDNTEALKYLTGAFIRSPEDEEVRKMIDELGGTLNPGQIYDERMKRQSQNAAESEEDEDLKTYQEIDKRIRNAEIIMADLVSDTSINARNYADEEDFHSDDPNDYMPLITQHEDEEEESLSGSPDDFLPQINKLEETQEPVETLSFNEASEDLTPALQEENSINEAQEDNNTDDLLSALSSEEDDSEDSAEALQEENSINEAQEDNNTDDLLSALSSEEDDSEDSAEALQEENSINEAQEDNNTDDLLSALSSEEDDSEDSAEALQEENSINEAQEDNNTDDLLSALSSEEDDSEDSAEALQEEDVLKEIDGTPENTDINSQAAIEDEQPAVIEESEEKEDNKELSVFEEPVESNEDTLNETEDIQNIIEDYADAEDTVEESVLTADNESENEDTELLKKQVPSSFGSMTYDDMIDDDFQYGKIVDDSYKDSDNPSIDLGESAPFTQGDIMDEILSAVGMTHDDMADDEKINISEKDRKLMRLENFLEKVQHNKESK